MLRLRSVYFGQVVRSRSAGIFQCYEFHTVGINHKEKQILHRSILRTDKFQNSLPRLPIPKLGDTLERYLDSQRALHPTDSSEYKHTESVVRQFEASSGPYLDKILRQRDRKNKHTSYISDFWFEAYLKARVPVVFNYNPFITLKDDTRPDYSDQIVRATNLIVSSLRFRNAHQENCLDPDVYHLDQSKSDTDKFRKLVKYVPDKLAWFTAYLHKAFPLDMSQYPRLFASTRIPVTGHDRLESHPNARHIVVIRKGQFYTFDAYEPDGHIVDPQRIYANLLYIASQPFDEDRASLPLGLLTTIERNSWAAIREHLIELGNYPALHAIDSALFAVCLDDSSPTDIPSTVSQFLCGDPANRWFDKCFQLIVSPTGQASVNFEHSWGDGIAVLRYMNEVRGDSTQRPSLSLSTLDKKAVHEGIKCLEFNTDGQVLEVLKAAKKELIRKNSKFEISVARQPALRREHVKAAKLSPDAVLQFALQLAYYRLSGGKTAPTYESCSTAAFKHGRTETIRSATCETRAACELIGDSSGKAVSNSMIESIQKCAKKHVQLTKEAAMGQGWDRHLMALRKMAEFEMERARSSSAAKGNLQFTELTNSLPAVFTDPSYKSINHIIVSTSTLSSPNIELGGFGPVVADGFGLGYGINHEEAGCCVTAYKGDNKYSAKAMADCIQDSFLTVSNIMKAATKGSS